LKLFGFVSDLVKASTDNNHRVIVTSDCVAIKAKKAQYRGPKGYFSVKLKAKYKSRVDNEDGPPVDMIPPKG
jgi:hypothetical protein